MRYLALVLGAALILPNSVSAQKKAVQSAMSAGPHSMSEHATIMNWDMETIKEGANDWTCLPDRPDTPGTDPWCIDDVWASFLHAFMQGEEPQIERLGIAYMLAGDASVSNIDPAGTEEGTPEGQWVEGLGAHLMLLVPKSMMEGLPTEPYNGGPWIMWPDTPYAHVMIPIDSFGGME